MSETFRQVCICGRSFSDAGAFTRHHKTCQKGRKRLSSALIRAKEIYENKKRRIAAESEPCVEHCNVQQQETIRLEDPTTASSGPSQCGPSKTDFLTRQVLLLYFSELL
jgi:hypothetical protein